MLPVFQIPMCCLCFRFRCVACVSDSDVLPVFQILMCSVYGVCKVVERDIRFKAIVQEYRNLPTAQPDVCSSFDVLNENLWVCVHVRTCVCVSAGICVCVHGCVQDMNAFLHAGVCVCVCVCVCAYC